MSDYKKKMGEAVLLLRAQADPDWAAEEITRLQSEVERLRGRCGELEHGLEGIANCAYGYSHPKAQTADEAASWMNGEAMRLLGDPQPSGWLLRKQADAVESVMGMSANSVADYAQRLRQQAAESENGN